MRLRLFYTPMAPSRYSLLCCLVPFLDASVQRVASIGGVVSDSYSDDCSLRPTIPGRPGPGRLRGWAHSPHGHSEPPLVGVTAGDFRSEAGQAWSLSEKHGLCDRSELTESSIHSFEREEVDMRPQYCLVLTEEVKLSLSLSSLIAQQGQNTI